MKDKVKERKMKEVKETNSNVGGDLCVVGSRQGWDEKRRRARVKEMKETSASDVTCVVDGKEGEEQG